MRYNVLTKNSTKQERIVYEVLKDLRIPFKHRWLIGGIEVDFLIGTYAIDIDGHDQSGERNFKLIEIGYVPIHFSNHYVINNRDLLKKELLKYGSTH